MSETRIPLNARAAAHLRDLQAKVQAAQPILAAFNAAVDAHLASAEVNGPLTGLVMDGDVLVVTTPDAPPPADAPQHVDG
jgi:hypothetical protein